MTAVCHCGVDWRGLREALELTQSEFAALLWVSKRSIKRYERRGARHACAIGATVHRLRDLVRVPHNVALLAANGFSQPFSPTSAGDDAPAPTGEICELDGLALATHPFCVGCTELVGEGHLTKQVDRDGVCPSCRAADEVRQRQTARRH